MEIAIEIKTVSGKNRGVFATRDIAVGEIVETCPVIPLTAAEREHLETTILDNYIYPWQEEEEDACMVLGLGSLINHSYSANTDWKPDIVNLVMNYVATKPIKKGEEVTTNYNGDSNDKTPIDWFEVK